VTKTNERKTRKGRGAEEELSLPVTLQHVMPSF